MVLPGHYGTYADIEASFAAKLANIASALPAPRALVTHRAWRLRGEYNIGAGHHV